jgi:hypothetical protein
MSIIDSIKSVFSQVDNFAQLLEQGNLNELLLNQRIITGENITTTSSIQVIKQSDDTTLSQEKSVNKATRIQVNPDPNYKIPVLYGRAVFGGAVTDVALAQSGNELQICLTLCMATGDDIAGNPSTYEFYNVYYNDQLITFQSNGQLAASLTDTNGNVNTDYAGKIGVYLYNSSSNHILPVGSETSGTTVDARNVFATWTTEHQMPGVIFAIVRIAWDPDLGLTEIPDIRFDIQNSLRQPGDVLYDYMRNTVYGCAISDENIKATAL